MDAKELRAGARWILALAVAAVAPAACGDDGAPANATTSSASGSPSGSGAGATGSGGEGDGGAPVELPTGRVEIGFWCGVPLAEMKQSRFDEIAEAGFTFVMNACEGGTFTPAYNEQMLELAGHAGLKANVVDTRGGAAVAGQDVDANLDALVADYSGSPSLLAYHITDEPGTAAFGALGTVVAGLAARDPDHFSFINLLPDYATAGQLGAPTYDAYVAQFVEAVKPALLSYDHYNFYSDGTDGPTFFRNLAVVRAHSVSSKTPFWQIIQSISYNGHRTPTGPEKRWAALHTLLYGGTGVMWFTYWTPPQTVENFGSGILDIAGAKTPQYAEVTDINRVVQAMGKYLSVATSTSVFHNGPLALATVPRAPGEPVYIPSPAPITVGTFAVGDDAYALLVNRDHAAPVESDVYVTSADGAPEMLDVTTLTFVPVDVVAKDEAGAKIHVALAAGDGLLIHMRGPLPAGPPGAEAFVGTVRSDSGSLDVVDTHFGTQRLRGAGWDDCPAGYLEVGKDFQQNGFWLCARNDIATRTFYVGNVVADAGALYSIAGGKTTLLGGGGWDQCPAGALLGHRFESNGFWVCME